MNARAYLEQIEKIDVMINNKIVEAEQWWTRATGTTVPTEGERVQTSSGKQKMADAVDRYIELMEEVNVAIDKLVNTRKEIISTIEQLPTVEYDILHMKYIQGKDLVEIGEKYKRSRSWAKDACKKAVKQVQEVLDARGNDYGSM